VAPISDIALLKVQLVEQHEQRSPVTNKEDYKDSSVWMIIHIPQEHTSSLSDSSTSTPTPDHDDEHFFTFMECSGWLDSGAYRVMKIPLTAVLCVLDASWKTVSEYSSQSKSLSAIKPGLSAFMMSICIETPRSVDIAKVLKSTDLDLFEAASAVMTTTSLAFITMTPDQTYLKSTSLDTFRCVWRLEELKTQIASLRFYISNQNLALFPDFLQRQALLRTLGYISVDSTVLLKGRVACEMNTCDELLACEMLFDNILEPLNPPEAAGVLAALVFQEKVNDSPKLTTRMEEARALLGKQLVRLSVLQEDFGIRIDDDNRPSLNFGLSAVVYEWARGTSFRDITSMTLVQEGSIVRCITRLDELMKDLRNAARVVGNPSLYRKMEAASQCIRRDIVFAASMYVT
jgi:superfamily II RNA helicase